MRKIIDYRVVEDYSETITEEVRKYIKVGWQPLGGMFYTSGTYRGQAMVKYEEEEEEYFYMDC